MEEELAKLVGMESVKTNMRKLCKQVACCHSRARIEFFVGRNRATLVIVISSECAPHSLHHALSQLNASHTFITITSS